MSQTRQRLRVEDEPNWVVRSMAANMWDGYLIDGHSHPWHQLICCSSGAMTVYGGGWSWITPPGKAILIPCGVTHSMRMWGDVAAKFLYFAPQLKAPSLESRECRVLSVTPLLRELVARVIEWQVIDPTVAGRQSLLDVLLDEMNVAADTPLGLPLPVDARAAAVARHVLISAAAASDSVESLSRRFGASRRTLERLFRQETGLSFGLWRQKARMLDAIRLLSEGRSVTTVALDTGYGSLSAFIAAFRKTFGYTPGRFDDGPR